MTNLASVNANEVNTDVLTKSDPDISDLQFDMLEGINTNETIQEQIDNVTVDVSTLQGQMNTANTNISALQVNLGIAQSDINTLQSEMNTAQSDINDLQTDVGVLYGLTATNTAAITGLSISQAAQDVTIASHTASISVLNVEMNDAQSQITSLEVKTTDQSWASISKTTFSTRVNIGSTSAGVELYTTSASTFGSGISASAPITTTSTMSSTSGTSSFNALNVNTTIEVIGDAIIGNTLYVGRTVNAEKKVVLYDGGTDNDYDYTGMWTSQTIGKNYFNYEIDGTGGAFRWHYGNGLGNARKKILDINDAEFYSYNATFSFLNSQIGGQTQNVTFTDNAFGTFYMNWKTDPDNTASQNRDAAIVVDAGADGVEDDGTMTFVAGAHDMTATTRGISITGNTLVQINAGASGFDVNSTGAVTVDSATTTTLTSVGETEINSAALDINASGAITIDGATVGLNGTTTILGVTNINATGGANTTIGTSATGNVVLRGLAVALVGSTAINDTGTAATTIGNTTGTLQLKGSTNTITGVTNINHLNTLATTIGNTTGILTLRGATIINTTGTANTSIGNSTGIITLTAGDMNLTATDIIIEATGTSSGSIDIIANETLDLFSTLDAINLTSGLNTNISAVLIKLDATTLIEQRIGGVLTQEISASGIINNPTGSIANKIGGVDKLTISSTTVAVINNLTVSQTNYTQPMASAFQLGYTDTLTGSVIMTVTLAQRATFTLPQKGVWLVVLGYQWTGGAANTLTLKRAIISATTASSTPAAPGLRYYEEMDVGVTATLQQQGTIMGVYTATAATTLYLNASANVNTGIFPTLAWSISWTRIG